MAGLLGINSSWVRSQNWANADADLLLTTGYSINYNTISNVPSDFGILFVISSGGQVSQFYLTASYKYPAIYYRVNSENTWSEWKTITMS